jgi:hypothetical protein
MANENSVALMNRTIELAAPNMIDVESRQYSDKPLHPVLDPTPDTLELSTIASLVDYAKMESPIDPIVHIASPTEVRLISSLHGDFFQRSIFAKAVCRPPQFDFGRFTDHEEFMISLQALFEETPDRETVMSVIGNIADEGVATYEDDGISQKVTVKAGITRRSEAKVPNPVKLAPYRTFSEVAQPVSPFILRMKKGSPLPSVALFEADGGLWKLGAIENIKKFLVGKLPDDFTIIG